MLNVLNIIHLLLHIFPWSSSSDEKGKGRINLLFRDTVAQSFYSCSFSSCFIVFPFVLLAISQAQHFFLFKNIYLLFLNFWLHWIFVAVHRLSLIAMYEHQTAASVIMVHRLRCPTACGTFLDQGSMSPALASGFLTTGPSRKSRPTFLVSVTLDIMKKLSGQMNLIQEAYKTLSLKV